MKSQQHAFPAICMPFLYLITFVLVGCFGGEEPVPPNDSPASDDGTKLAEPTEKKSLYAAPEFGELDLLTRAMTTYDRQLYTNSVESWTALRDGYPSSPFSALAEIKIADARFFSSDYPAAIAAYEEFARLHPGHEAMPYIRFQIAQAHLEQHKGASHDQSPLTSAKKEFEQVRNLYPKTEYGIRSAKMLKVCEEREIEHELLVAGFYLKRGQHSAFIDRLNRIRQKYPASASRVDELQQQANSASNLEQDNGDTQK